MISGLLYNLQAVEQSTDCTLFFLHIQAHFSYHRSQQNDCLSSWSLQLLHHLQMEMEKEEEEEEVHCQLKAT